MATVSLLSARGLTKSFGGRRILDALDLEHDDDGTVVAVSHDRCFLDRIADRIVVVAGGAAHAYDGGRSANLARA